jgi:hypothetical protein
LTGRKTVELQEPDRPVAESDGVEPDASFPEECSDPCRRQDRQRAEILRAIDQQHVHRAADLAHEHLAEFPEDHVVREHVLDAVMASPDRRLRNRAGEFRVADPPAGPGG